MRRVLPALVATVSAALLATSALAASWSFETHPIPHPDALTPAETRALDAAGPIGAGIADFCAAHVAAYLALYAARHPGFAATGEAGGRAFRQSAFARGLPGLGECVLYVPLRQAIALLPDLQPEPLFCGQPARSPRTGAEAAFLAAAGEMLAYAGAGHPVAVVNLLALEGISPAVDFSEDLEYALRRSLARDGVEDPAEWETAHLPGLTPARRAALDAALDRHDLSPALVACTGPNAEGRP